MNELKLLFKNNINLLLGRLQGKKQRKSTALAITLLVFGIIGLLAIYSLQAWSMFQGLAGLGKLCVFHGIITTITVILIIGIMRVNSKTKENDSDFLLSLPIKRKNIIISKLVNKYLFDLFFSFILLLPYVVLYEITANNFTFDVLVCGVLVVLLLPLLSVGISCVVEFLIARFFNKIRCGNVLKSLIPTLIYILLMILLLLKTSGYGSVNFETMEDYFANRPISNLILKFIFDHSIDSIIVVLSLTILPFCFGAILYWFNYGKDFGTYVNFKNIWKFKQLKKPFNCLLKKEIVNYFTTPAYLINTIIGPIIIVVFSIIAVILGKNGITNLIGIDFSSNYLVYILALIFNGCISATLISCCSISLEGQNIWILRSMPVSVNQIFLSKIFNNIIIVEPCVLISSLLIGISLNEYKYMLLLFGISTLFLILNAGLGLLINLWLPKLNWQNETEVVKQGLSVLVTMVFSLILTIIPVAIFLIFKCEINLIVLISFLIYLLCLVIVYALLFTKGKILFNKLEN